MYQFVTSMNKKLYNATGKHLIKSFRKYGALDRLLVFSEDPTLTIPYFNGIVPMYRNLFLERWAKDNADVIPYELGGDFRCKCRYNIKFKQKGHKEGCPAGGMKRRACHWIKKVATWDMAVFLEIPMFIWVDCDCVAKCELPHTFSFLHNNHPVQFHYGIRRRYHDTAIESGITVFHGEYGHNIIKEVVEEFSSGKFREYKNWGDHYVLTKVCERLGYDKTGDLTPNAKTTDPIKEGPFNEYFEHHKGIHWREHNVNG